MLFEAQIKENISYQMNTENPITTLGQLQDYYTTLVSCWNAASQIPIPYLGI